MTSVFICFYMLDVLTKTTGGRIHNQVDGFMINST